MILPSLSDDACFTQGGSFTEGTMESLMESANSLFTWIFIVELMLKLIAFGISKYVSDTMNIFDGVIVLFSLFEMLVLSGGNSKAFSAFKSIRIFR